MIKLLILDLDGTLADTGQDITNALNYALGPFGAREYSLKETKAMVGSGISKLLESLIARTPLLSKGNAEGKVNLASGEKIQANESSVTNAKDLAVSRFIEYYDNHLVDNTYIYPHVKETLAQLNGYKKAVLSNKREVYSKKVLEELNILQYFDLIWGSDSVREKKPSPVPILDMMERFGVSQNETVLIGDSNYDVDAGKAAGVRVVAVTYGFRSRELLKNADYIIDTFDELLNILPGL